MARKILNKEINAKLGILICDKPDAKALSIAKEEFAMSSYFVDAKSYFTKAEYEKEMIRLLKEVKTDLVVTAGYMRILSPYFVNEFKNKIINIHPSLLPAFGGKGCYGIHVHEKVIEAGVKITGVTVHFVNEHYDSGKIIAQSAVPVLPGDTPEILAKRVLQEEHNLYWQVIRDMKLPIPNTPV
ncbi:MAG: phosphoribosylglycinamide formyltransferase, partial [Leptospirales bacterium]|nr:phosphoribosylglycinamide formyltransferase [Leptospirales bacterium]